MRVVIVGAGDVGQQMAQILCHRKNDVVVIDLDEDLLERLQDTLDIMTIVGNGSTARSLRMAGIDKTSLLLAVSGNSEANILACSMAHHFNVPMKVARIHSGEYFDESLGISSSLFGVDEAIITEYECATNMMEALLRPAIKETVHFSHADAQLVNFQVKAGSPLIGVPIKNFPRPEFLQQLRFCAILRYGQLIIPRGDTSFIALDEVYIAGRQTDSDELISWADPNPRWVSKVIIAGCTPVGRMLATMLAALDMRVCMIEPDRNAAERAADVLGASVVVINGASTDVAILKEAGIDSCDAYVACDEDNETNILSCILARRNGAGKVITVTSNLDYLQIIASMNMIDCGFSPLVAAVNSMIEHISTEKRRTVAMLKRIPAEVMEIEVHPGSMVAGNAIMALDVPREIIFALIIRDGNLVPAVGPEVLHAGDRVIVLAESHAVEQAERLFIGKDKGRR